jgi:hypothetical protein
MVLETLEQLEDNRMMAIIPRNCRIPLKVEAGRYIMVLDGQFAYKPCGQSSGLVREGKPGNKFAYASVQAG